MNERPQRSDEGLFQVETQDADNLGPTGRPLPDLPEPTPPAPGPKRAIIISMTNQKGLSLIHISEPTRPY